MKCAIEMNSGGMIFLYIQSFMKICTGIQTILRFCLNNMKGCNVGVTDVEDVWS
jgi:hypothetical protein